MAEPQSTHEILSILQPIVGESVDQLQVLGVNTLKSILPSPQDLVGSTITSVSANDRIVRIHFGSLSATVDLQRTGRLIWRGKAGPARISQPAVPTMRLLLESGSALDFSEPGKTKRISVILGGS